MGVTIYWSMDCLYNLEDYLGGNFGTLETVFLTLAGFLGVVGNSINILILHKKELRSPVTILVFFLSLFDFCLCAGYFTIGCWALTKTKDKLQDWQDWNRLWKYFAILVAAGYQGSCYITAGIALERLVLVYKPFIAKTIVTIKTSLAISLGITLLVITQTLIGLFFDICDNQEAAKITSMTITFILPFVCSTVSNALIIWRVFVQGKRRAKLTNNTNNSNRITKLLVIIISINVLSLAVYLTSGFIFDEAEFLKILKIDKLLRIIVPYLLSFNSAVNVILYSVYSREYLKKIIKLFHVGWFLKFDVESAPTIGEVVVKRKMFGEE